MVDQVHVQYIAQLCNHSWSGESCGGRSHLRWKPYLADKFNSSVSNSTLAAGILPHEITEHPIWEFYFLTLQPCIVMKFALSIM